MCCLFDLPRPTVCSWMYPECDSVQRLCNERASLDLKIKSGHLWTRGFCWKIGGFQFLYDFIYLFIYSAIDFIIIP